MQEVILWLYAIAGVWIIAASMQDLIKREVANWINFSLIAFAISFRIFYSAFSTDLMFLLYGVMGLFIFFLLANLFYYSRIFAGGDAKLLIALGAVLPSGTGFYGSLTELMYFVFLFLICGSVYGIAYSVLLVLRKRGEFTREFSLQLKDKKILIFLSLGMFVFSFITVYFFNETVLFLFPLIFLLFPFLLIYAKSVEECCMVKSVRANELNEGDWLYEALRLGNKRIKPKWEGLTQREIMLIRKEHKGRVKIKEGIAFVPAFLIAYIVFFCLVFFGYI